MPRSTDELDWDIVKEIISPASMRWNVREPYSRIAERLAIDEETLRRRVVQLRESGIIGDFVLFLNPGLLGRKNGLMYVDAKDYASITRAIPKLKLIDGIVSLTSVHEAGLLVSTYYEGESAFARQMALVESVCEGEIAMHWTAPYPEFGGPLTKTDWIILQALRRNPRRKLPDLASDIGVSSRTVNRRMKRLNDGMAMFLFLEFDLAKIQGLRYLLLVHCDNEAKKKEVDGIVISGLRRLVYTETWAPNHSMFAFACENIVEADKVSSWLRKLNGVSDIRLGILKSRVHSMDWIDEEIERRITSL